MTVDEMRAALLARNLRQRAASHAKTIDAMYSALRPHQRPSTTAQKVLSQAGPEAYFANWASKDVPNLINKITKL